MFLGGLSVWLPLFCFIIFLQTRFCTIKLINLLQIYFWLVLTFGTSMGRRQNNIHGNSSKPHNFHSNWRFVEKPVFNWLLNFSIESWMGIHHYSDHLRNDFRIIDGDKKRNDQCSATKRYQKRAVFSLVFQVNKICVIFEFSVSGYRAFTCLHRSNCQRTSHLRVCTHRGIRCVHWQCGWYDRYYLIAKKEHFQPQQFLLFSSVLSLHILLLIQ